MRRWLPLILIVLAPACGDDGPVRPPLLEPPVLHSVSVTPNDVLTDTVLVAVQAERADTVSLWVDGSPALADTEPPYLLAWDSRSVANGAHDLTLRAQNRGGTSATTLLRLVINLGRGALVSVFPADTMLVTGKIARFTAVVVGEADPRVTWSVEPLSGEFLEGGGGTVDSSGLYTAPSLVSEGAEVLVRATSVADPAGSGTARVAFDQAVRVVITGTPSRVRLGRSYALAAQVYGSSYDQLDWKIVEGSFHGTVEGNVYHAPSAMPSRRLVTFVARALYYPQIADTATAVMDYPLSITFLTAPSTVYLRRSYQLQARVYNQSDQRFLWSIDEGPGHGAIDQNGVYTAPPVKPDPPQVTLRATTLIDTTESVARTVPILSPVAITITKAPSTVYLRYPYELTAAVSGTTDTRVRWSLDEGPDYGVIDQTGHYTAPLAQPQPPSVTFRATSLADTNESAAAVAAILGPVTVTMKPVAVTAITGEFVQFTAVVRNSPDARVEWSVDGGPEFGTISGAGLYAAPAVLPDPPRARIHARSADYPAAGDSALVELAGGPTAEELALIDAMFDTSYRTAALCEQAVGIAITAVRLARYLSGDDTPTAGTLTETAAGWTYRDSPDDWLIVYPKTGLVWTIRYLALEEAPGPTPDPRRFWPGTRFRGELVCRMFSPLGGVTVTNSSRSPAWAAKTGAACEATEYERTLRGVLPAAEGGYWEVNVDQRGATWDCADDFDTSQRLSGYVVTPAGLWVTLDDSLSLVESRSLPSPSYYASAFQGEFSVVSGANLYRWNDIRVATYRSYGLPIQLNDWLAIGSLEKNGAPYGEVRFTGPVISDPEAAPDPVLALGSAAWRPLPGFPYGRPLAQWPVAGPFRKKLW